MDAAGGSVKTAGGSVEQSGPQSKTERKKHGVKKRKCTTLGEEIVGAGGRDFTPY